MSKKRMETWLTLLVLGVALIPLALLGLWGYINATATPLHSNPQDVSSVAESAPSPEWTAAVGRAREIARAGLIGQNLPGLSAAVGAGGEVVWAEGFGWSNLQDRVPVTPRTRFRIGTGSVPLTSAAVGLLLEDGRLKLDDVIQSYVPEFPEKDWPVTLRQLMGHVAGVRNDGGDEGPLLSKSCERPVEALQAFGDNTLRFEPGTEFRYSSYGWILVSAAVEAAAGEPFLNYMQRQVFDPVGMDDTLAESAREEIPSRATSYFPRFAGDPGYGLHLMRPIDYSCYAGASVFLSTPSDLVRFGMAITSGRLLRPATVELLQTSQRLRSGEETGYGLGWVVDSVEIAGKPTRRVGHGGATLGGAVASLMTFPEQDLVVSVISNISYADAEAVALKIAQAFSEVERSAGGGDSSARRRIFPSRR